MNTLSYFVIAVVGLLGLVGSANADLRMGFYSKSCPKAEKIVQDYVNKHIPNVPSLAAALIRLHFHDCFLRVSNLPFIVLILV